MPEYQSDDERAEALRQWWVENGKAIVAGVIMAILGLMGWRYWQDYSKTQNENASALYAQVEMAKDATSGKRFVSQLENDYQSTPYAALANLHLAKQQIAEKQDKQAITTLRWIVNNGSDKPIVDIATLRLSRLLVAENQPDEAERLLKNEFSPAYSSLITELQGDIHLARDEIDKAREAYDKAILSSGGRSINFLKMKRDDLGTGA